MADRTSDLGVDLPIPLLDIEVRTSRSGGPGGQHANVTASRVEVVVDVRTCRGLRAEQRRRIEGKLGPRVSAVAQDSRSQLRNRELALERLAGKLRAALVVPRKRRPTRPTKGSKVRRLDAKKQRGATKDQRRKPDF